MHGVQMSRCDITFTRIRGFVSCEFLRQISCAWPFEEFVKQNERHGDNQHMPKILGRERQIVGEHRVHHTRKTFRTAFLFTTDPTLERVS